ncbi:MAG: glycosyltransferase family 2 protein [Candidatus Aminicenantes bacterium]|nr:glycosyltransferase family 2 protein [Candidatus Aminicenantes bacterium]
MRETPFLSVIIPVYNYAEKIKRTISDIDKKLNYRNFSYEIIVVNDGSTDNTAEIVHSLTGVIRNIRFIDNKKNEGKGKVVRQGILEAKGSIRLFTDVDNSTPIDQLDKFFPFFKEGCDIVFGSRAVKDARVLVRQPFYRILLGKMGNLIIQLMVLPGIKDTQCGFKAFTQEAVQEIFPKLTINGWGFDIEILALAKLFGLRIKEVGIDWINNPVSKFKAFDYFKIFLETLRIRWNIWIKNY